MSIALASAAIIALQLAIMRIFAVGSWAHFGSLVVSWAMLGFGLSSAGLCATSRYVKRRADAVATAALLLFGPVTIAANLAAQQVPFNAVFMLQDAQQRWRLAANFALYLAPFVAGATFLGAVFVRNGKRFGRVYFADLAGAGVGGVASMLASAFVPPDKMILVPFVLAVGAGACWTMARGNWWTAVWLCTAALSALALQSAADRLGAVTLAVSDYKGVAYARKLPDSRRVLHRLSPYGELEAYASSYLHFAPGLSDNAAFNLPELPKSAYLGLYLDGDGPAGVIRDLPAHDTAYFGYLPMVYPYLLKPQPEVFVAQFGGGISTALALREGARQVTVAESNPVILGAFGGGTAIAAFTGHLLTNPRVGAVAGEGRSYLRATGRLFDIVDLSLATSTGLSNPGGFSIVERFGYTREAMRTYMRALRPGGILSVTLWNKEDPPKSVLRLYATMVAAARDVDPAHIADGFFAVSSYLSTTTVLYQRGGFGPNDITALRAHTAAMSFDELYSPGVAVDATPLPDLLAAYRGELFGAADAAPVDSTAQEGPATLPAVQFGRLVWDRLVRGGWQPLAGGYVFDIAPLDDDRPYFAGYLRVRDLPRLLDRLDLLQDEWGYLLLWFALAVSVLAALLLVALPAAFGWRTVVSDFPGRGRTIAYFGCLGVGYIAVEIGLVSKFVLALSNYTVSAAVTITSLLVCSGIGSLLSQRALDGARRMLPALLGAIGVLLLIEAACFDPAIEWIGTLPAVLRPVGCVVLMLPAAVLMGFPMPLAMTTLARLGKERVFVWAWGINGCCSVVGATLAPIVATSLGLDAVLALAGSAYLAAIPAVGGLFRTAAPAVAASL
ncbi:MAG: hypothetical protein JO258_00585 [Alphaproteobacteria bacterium]|nr:hypothetical protein [Alphaproteobacteria bacterium]